jgi:hypothetical protein
MIADISSNNRREINRMKITDQNLLPFGIFREPTTLYTLLLMD